MGNLFSKKPKIAKPGNGPSKPPGNNPPGGNIPVPSIPAPTPQPPPPPRVLARALYTYEGQNRDDLRFSKGDVMYIMSNMSEPWWLAEHTRTKEKGYIPSNYVVIDDGRPTSLDAWYDISRREADKLLLMMGNPSGSYIIRPSSDPRHYALSVRCHMANNFWVVKHYKIRTLDNNAGYFISNRTTFSCIQDLIRYYQEHVDGLCCQLSNPCPRTYRPPVQFRDIEVNRDSIETIRKLGNGSFGEVWLAKWNNTIEVAVKMLKSNSMDREKFIKEAELMHKLHHPRIVQILGICKEPPNSQVLIITELMTKGALLDFLRKDEGRLLTIVEMIDMMAQICEGMAYLESMNFVHRDLRAANILVGGQNFVKVADFGLARITEVEDDSIYQAEEGAKFPIKWTAPEAAVHRFFSVKSDVWSFGILMYEMVTYGRTPYPGMNNAQVIDEVNRGYRLPNPHGGNVECPEDLYQIMLKCWETKPENRYTFQHLNEVFEHWLVSTETQYLDNQNV